jgi:serine phosphatase RsbU (regulator of sigma subunit)
MPTEGPGTAERADLGRRGADPVAAGRVAAFLRRQPPGVLTLAGLLTIAVLGILDYLAGPDLSFLLFYVAPVLFLAWFVGRWAGFLGAAASATFWVYEDVLSAHAYRSSVVADWNIAVRLIFLMLFVHAVDRLKAAQERERRAERERIEREVQIARQVQTRLFPQAAPHIPGLDLHGICIPVAVVGGDYYDFLLLDPERVGIAVGDVAGKGISAALLMASLQATLRSHVLLSANGPADLASTINSQLYALTEPARFATLFWAVYDGKDRSLAYVNAGHNAPVVRRASGPAERLPAGGRPLGLFPAAAYLPDRVCLFPGDLVAVFSDGIPEAANAAGEEFGEARIQAVLDAEAGRSSAELCQLVLAAVRDFQAGTPPQDDMTIVVAKTV